MSNKQSDRELSVQREVPFRRELVWKAMTQPEHIANWWGPDGFRTENMTIDLRVGGVWQFLGIGSDGTPFPNNAIFKEIIPPSKLVFDQGDGSKMWFEATVTLEETEKGTLITINQIYPTAAFRDEVVTKFGALEGGRQHLAKLEGYIREHSSV